MIMATNSGLLVSFLLILVPNTLGQSYQRKETKECSFTLKDTQDDDSCPTFQEMLDKLDFLSQRISKIEDWFLKFPFLNEPKLPLNELDRIFANGVIAHYSFEENMLDSSGNNHHGNAINGVLYVTHGVAGRAASFTGNQKVNVESLRNFDWGSRFSVSVWFKRTGEWSNYQGIVSNGYHLTGSWELRMGREMSGQNLGGGVNTANSPKTWNYVNIKATKNEWHHVAMTYDGESLNYYLDNVRQEGDQDCCNGDILIKDTPVTIGQAGIGSSKEYFYGLLDELAIFSKVLSTNDINTIYSRQNPDRCDSSLIAYFPFDDSFDDKSCNKRTGKVEGDVEITVSDSISGSSAYFTGKGWINVESLSGYEWGSKFTVSVWFKRTGRWGDYLGIVSNGWYTKSSWEIRMGRENSGQRFGGFVVTPDSSDKWAYDLDASIDQWHHVAMTYDGSYLNFYLDNVKQEGNQSCCKGDMISRDNPLTIGMNGAGYPDGRFYGYIDELKLFSRVLSGMEVSEIYNTYTK